LEFIVDEDARIMFVDERPYPFELHPEPLVRNGTGKQIYFHEHLAKQRYRDGFDVERLNDLVEAGLAIGNNALLCHLVTRGLMGGQVVEILAG
jgi:tryptophanase